MCKWLVCLLLSLAPTAIVLAEEGSEQPALPKELAVTDSISMTDADESYFSGSLQRFKLPDQRLWTASLEAAYGLTDRLRISAEAPYVLIQPPEGPSASGIGDVEAVIRYAPIDYRQKPYGLDVGLGLISPTGDRSRGLGDGRTRVEPSLTASRWLGPLNVQLNLAWVRAVGGSGDEPRNEFDHNLAIIYPIRKAFLVLEGNGETAGGRTSYYVTPEVVFKASEHVEWLLAVPVGVTEAAGDYGLIVGCTIEIEHLFHRGRSAD